MQLFPVLRLEFLEKLGPFEMLMTNTRRVEFTYKGLRLAWNDRIIHYSHLNGTSLA